MKKKSFYTTIIDIESIYLKLDGLNLSKKEREELILLIDSNIHCAVLDIVLSELQEEDKKTFLVHLKTEDNEKIWQHLKSKIDDIEEKIKILTDKLKDDFENDIENLKKRTNY